MYWTALAAVAGVYVGYQTYVNLGTSNFSPTMRVLTSFFASGIIGIVVAMAECGFK